MDEWTRYFLTAVVSGGLCTVLSFAIKWKKASVDSWQVLFHQGVEERTALGLRQASLEKMVDELRHDHVKCLESQAEAKAKMAIMEDMTMKMHKDNKDTMLSILSEARIDRANILKMQEKIIDHISDIWTQLKVSKPDAV